MVETCNHCLMSYTVSVDHFLEDPSYYCGQCIINMCVCQSVHTTVTQVPSIFCINGINANVSKHLFPGINKIYQVPGIY